jgi:hypothetical protein
VNNDRDVVVVAARSAWPQYHQFQAYICQPNRSLGGATYLAFYAPGKICEVVPKIGKIFPDVEIGGKDHPAELANLLREIVRIKTRLPGQRNQIVLLSGPEDAETIKLPGPIKNDMKSKQQPDITVAFTMGQRYVSLANLKKAKTTSGLSSG